MAGSEPLDPGGGTLHSRVEKGRPPEPPIAPPTTQAPPSLNKPATIVNPPINPSPLSEKLGPPPKPATPLVCNIEENKLLLQETNYNRT
ncbi:hypothetical protein AMECASPLE_016169 [Ameca splendens]|uniref:Uncharacterized protein n=1 Tax=Ameca splendens TaxID=208324 RepID=A0ABV0Y218_9TELE